jgi:hypothetical protein
VLKQDILQKHMGNQQAEHHVFNEGLKTNWVYYENNNKHFSNFMLFAIQWPQFVLWQVGDGMAMQFVIFLHIL